MSSLSTGRMTAGSIEGAGTFSLGPNQLIVGSNSYTGATVVAGGTLSVTGDISPSSGVLVGPTAMLSGRGRCRACWWLAEH